MEYAEEHGFRLIFKELLDPSVVLILVEPASRSPHTRAAYDTWAAAIKVKLKEIGGE